ncbi:hypothetical protein D3C77_317440 [compost metagenome]
MARRGATEQGLDLPADFFGHAIFIDMASFGFSQYFRLELAFVSGRYHTDPRIGIHVHKAQGAEAVEPCVGHLVDELLTAGCSNLLFQLSHGLRILAAGGAAGIEYQGKLGTDLLQQQTSGVLGELLEFVDFHHSSLYRPIRSFS